MLRKMKNTIHSLEALLASFYYGFPSKSMKIIAVTGTDGKTTTTELIYHILKKAGKKASMISTLHAVIGKEEYDTGFHVTTPNSFPLQKFLNLAKKEKTEYMVLEVTSHALDQKRVNHIRIEVGLIANISHEHLDYHKTFDNYLAAKAKILKNVKVSILNADDSHFDKLVKYASGRLVTFGIKKKADFTPGNSYVKSRLPGQFNVYNILAAEAAASSVGISAEDIKKGVASFTGIQGRMEEVGVSRPFRIFIDFAHKPNALENVLLTTRDIADKRVIIVFGAAGLRDKAKRPMMGKIAGKLADISILTAEDPRTEDVRDIINSIAVGAKSSGAIEADKYKDGKDMLDGKHYYYRIADRQEAINFAVKNLAQKGDVVILAGKGHEKSLCYGKIEYSWDEFKAVEKALKNS